MLIPKDNIARNTLVTNLTRELQEMIVDGRIKVNEYFPPQKELAAQYGVGLSTIREAFQKLAAMGLVESHPGKGTWVSKDAYTALTFTEAIFNRLKELHAREAYEARSVIEVALTKFAAERATLENKKRIWNALHAMENAANDNEFVSADLDFHFAVAEAGNNKLLSQFYHLTRGLLSEIITEIISLPEVKEKSILLQKNIAQAIENSNIQEAQTAALEHMQYVETLLNENE